MTTSPGKYESLSEPKPIYKNSPVMEWHAIVRLGDIVPCETPNIKAVKKMIKAIKAGEKLPPMDIGSEFTDHWILCASGMEKTGCGYGLIDGHHRRMALLFVHGADHQIEVVMCGVPAVPVKELGKIRKPSRGNTLAM